MRSLSYNIQNFVLDIISHNNSFTLLAITYSHLIGNIHACPTWSSLTPDNVCYLETWTHVLDLFISQCAP